MRRLGSFLKRLFAGKPVVASRNVAFSQSRISLSQYAGEQWTYWDNKNKEMISFKIAIFFVFVVPVHLLFSSMAILYHLNR